MLLFLQYYEENKAWVVYLKHKAWEGKDGAFGFEVGFVVGFPLSRYVSISLCQMALYIWNSATSYIDKALLELG